MSEKKNMLALPEPWDLVSEGYAQTTMQVFKGYAAEAIKLLNLSEKSDVLDVACGPGTASLMLACKVNRVKAIDFSKAMLAELEREMEASSIRNIDTFCGDAQQLPYGDEQFDAALSMFGLMFFPDRIKGLSEIHRALKPGGRVVISSWAAVERSPAMGVMFGALRAIKPDLPEPKMAVESLENPDVLRRELQNQGFKDVEIHCVTKCFPVHSVEIFWQDMVRGSAPLIMMQKSMAATEWAEKEKLALAYLDKALSSCTTELTSDAWLGMGVK